MTDWQPMATAPKDRIIWIWHRSFAGGPLLAQWNDNWNWWSRINGGGSILMYDIDSPYQDEAAVTRQSFWFPAFPPLKYPNS